MPADRDKASERNLFRAFVDDDSDSPPEARSSLGNTIKAVVGLLVLLTLLYLGYRFLLH